MRKTVGRSDDADFVEDLELVVRKLPGYGAALARIIERAGATQQEIADELKCDRSTISHWIAERKWPDRQKLLNLLMYLNIDRKLLGNASAILFGGDVAANVFRACGPLNSFSVTKEALTEILKSEDDFTQKDVIFKALVGPAYLALGLRAGGLKGGESCDPRAAKLFFDEWREHQREVSMRETNGSGRTGSVAAEWTRRALGGELTSSSDDSTNPDTHSTD